MNIFNLEEGKFKGLIRFIYRFTWIGLLSALFFIFIVNINLFKLFGEMPSLVELENPKSQNATLIFSEDGQEIGKFFIENRNPIEFHDLSQVLVNTLISTEDARFVSHSGVDLWSLFRVAFSFGTSGGGSTLTQQLAKNLFNTRVLEYDESDPIYVGALMRVPVLKTVIAKVKEWILSVKLERRYTKQELLAMYLNQVSFGNNAYGIEVACRTYFQKNVKTVNYLEAATIIGMLKNPSLFNPVLRPELTLQRRNVVLGQLYKYDHLSKEELEELRQKPLGLRFKVENHNTGLAPYFTEAIKKQVVKVLREYNADRSDEEKLFLYTSGLRIYTTIDSRMQTYANEAVWNHMKNEQAVFNDHWRGKNPWVDEKMQEIPNFLQNTIKRTETYRALKEMYGDDEDKIWEALNKKSKMTVFSYAKGSIDTLMSSMDSLAYYKRMLNTGFMVMDPTNGHVKAYVGGVNHRFFKFDNITQSKRQPGSTFKPYVYGAAIDEEMATPCDHLTDEPVTFGVEDGLMENETWTPSNSDGVYSYKSLTLRKAMAQSINTIAAKLMKLLGPEKIADFAHRAGIESDLTESPALCLGASEVSVKEQVQGYSTLVNLGERIDPIMILKITDKNGNVIAEFTPNARQAIKPETAYKMTFMLRGAVEESGGTAERLRGSSIFAGNEIGAKTGTTSNYSDGWFMGATQKLVAGVWVGGEDRSIHFRNIQLGQGAKMALPIYMNFMEKVYQDKSLAVEGYRKMPFIKPDEVEFDFSCSGIPSDSLKQESP